MSANCPGKLILIVLVAVMVGGCSSAPRVLFQGNFAESPRPKTGGDYPIRHIHVNRNVSIENGDTFMVCTPPRRTVYDDWDANLIVLRMAPFHACQAISHSQISKKAYQAFLEDYSGLVLLVAGIKSLDQLEGDATTTTHRNAIESLADENQALKLMCAHPPLFAVERDGFDHCIVSALETNGRSRRSEEVQAE